MESQGIRTPVMTSQSFALFDTPIGPCGVVWGERDVYINKCVGLEFARRTGSPLSILNDVGHYPHLQDPRRTAAEPSVLRM